MGRLLCLDLLFKTSWRNRTIFWWVYFSCFNSRGGHYPFLCFSKPCWMTVSYLSLICYGEEWADQWVSGVECTGNILCAMWYFLLSTRICWSKFPVWINLILQNFWGEFFGLLLWWLNVAKTCISSFNHTVCSCLFIFVFRIHYHILVWGLYDFLNNTFI